MGIVGQTATGKSWVAHEVAHELGDVEIVTVDSMQVYKGMDIGTAKPTAAMRAQVHYHLLDVVDPTEVYSLKEFQEAAKQVVADIEARGRRPLLVGGTGLYLRAIVDDLAIPGQFPEVREQLDAIEDDEQLYERLRALDPIAAKRIEPANRRRIIRALEVTLGSGQPFSSSGVGLEAYPENGWDVVAFMVDTHVGNERIAQRYQEQLRQGFLAEVEALCEGDRPLSRTARQALGYRQLIAHLAGECSVDEAIEQAIVATRRFARRQRSWFQRDPRLEWFSVTDVHAHGNVVEVLVARWKKKVAVS